MKSIKSEMFDLTLAESQEKYNTLHVNINAHQQMCPATIEFELEPQEVEDLLSQYKETGKIKLFYQQCLFRAEMEHEGKKGYVPANLFHPMSIHTQNPIDITQWYGYTFQVGVVFQENKMPFSVDVFQDPVFWESFEAGKSPARAVAAFVNKVNGETNPYEETE